MLYKHDYYLILSNIFSFRAVQLQKQPVLKKIQNTIKYKKERTIFIKKSLKHTILVGGIGFISVLALSGCSAVNNFKHDTFNNNNYHYTARPQTLHGNSHVEAFSIDYYDASSNHSADQMLSRNVNAYLNSIQNLKDYDWDVKPASVGDDQNNREDQVLTDQVVLKRKKPTNPVQNNY